ncbi:type I methionyl aminopeptidase [Sphingobacteriaceae bacterium WQ 2009]|uniref:Methionine aminopeptidase n=1 Tax=Rhinopithecimicrobium faecis TaxID=2820698 RepID=A0A8T4HFW2_9SPHI|nr:type I methionyl aminopeptidase [Sphingobacteriaceae bacterium WQ 2009]
MTIQDESDLIGMKKAAEAVALTLKEMRNFTKIGMSTKEIDDFGGEVLKKYGAVSAPFATYKFPGFTCISLNDEVAHGIPAADRIIQDGDLINIDVSAELGGFWADNGGSFVIGNDIHQYQPIVDASKYILHKAIMSIKGGVKICDIGGIIEQEAKKRGFKVIKNLTGHGIGRGLHEEPLDLLNFKDKFDTRRFKKNSVVAIETFISSKSTMAVTQKDGWTMKGNVGGFFAQHEHTLVITDNKPLILTEMNDIWA